MPTVPIPQRLTRDADGRLFAHYDGTVAAVSVRPCFPWTEHNRFLSLRDGEFQELFLIEDMDQLDPSSREALEGAVAEVRFTFTVTAIRDIVRDFELRIWTVDTEEGKRSFATEWDDFPKEMLDGSLVLKDLGGDLYRIPNPDELNAASQRHLWSFRK